jgi:hypothetical protein
MLFPIAHFAAVDVWGKTCSGQLLGLFYKDLMRRRRIT